MKCEHDVFRVEKLSVFPMDVATNVKMKNTTAHDVAMHPQLRISKSRCLPPLAKPEHSGWAGTFTARQS